MPPSSPTSIAGLVLAAGAGSRYGLPKALAGGGDGVPWLVRTIRTLADACCSPVIVVLGARADDARALLVEFALTGATDVPGTATRTGAPTPPVLVVQAEDWAEGLSASLRAGLRAATSLAPEPEAVAIVPVDVPGLRSSTVARLIAPLPGTRAGKTGSEASVGPDTLRQAGFLGRPGHPVVIGRAHWPELIRSSGADTGARPYLQAHHAHLVECSDLETGLDIDRRD
ncbi:nucleotidyltransferase family protein [Cryobacterium sp. TMT2-10]|uniref:nucleotidyltransferase family protein n=1 Tax=unclassified Cryobacterium TaxID=2649013 RepID=UPI00106AD807|nr:MULTISPECIES: nucleotidyltransferase family protein [unclassified Cryobacterium]TFD19077.1 nucleotidyltransferase family protein [Cryobacterium sp. TMT4-10]TFD37010.1 nucleotidyltransferase family protein [Cryobacterium sp. TMT2-10]